MFYLFVFECQGLETFTAFLEAMREHGEIRRSPIFSIRKEERRAGRGGMAQQVKAPATKPDNLSFLILGPSW